jgi:pantoate kinase
VATVVNGDPSYDAKTTRKAVELFVEKYGPRFGRLELEQRVDVPIGCGFGASAASAVSAVYAAAAALRVRAPRPELARLAYDAEIIERTGLGTVSVIYGGTGAGAITKPGVPGVSEFLNVPVPSGARLVTATLGPMSKGDALSSAATARRIVRLGGEALARFASDPSFDSLGRAGEWFAGELSLDGEEVRELARAAKAAGATHSSQNMIGRAVHAVVDGGGVGKVVSALKATGLDPEVAVHQVGTAEAGPF